VIVIEKIIPVRFYQELSGKEPVHVWLMKLSKKDRKIIGEDIKKTQKTSLKEIKIAQKRKQSLEYL